MNLVEKYKKFKENFVISEKQKLYIVSLANEIEIENPLSLLDRKVELWNELTEKETKFLIYKLLNSVRATPKQVLLIKSKFKEDEVKNLIKHGYDDLTRNDINYLMKKFTFWSVDHPIRSDQNWEYGQQKSDYCKDGIMYYLKFYDFVMIDFDGVEEDEVTFRLESFPEFTFRLYSTFNGFHAFLISKSMRHNSDYVNFLLRNLGCDPYYILFAQKVGFKIRLNKKINRQEQFVAKYIKTIGDENNVDEKCLEYVKLHDKLINVEHPYTW